MTEGQLNKWDKNETMAIFVLSRKANQKIICPDLQIDTYKLPFISFIFPTEFLITRNYTYSISRIINTMRIIVF